MWIFFLDNMFVAVLLEKPAIESKNGAPRNVKEDECMVSKVILKPSFKEGTF